MATPYVMSKVTSCYFSCESDADLPDCCKDVSKACSQRYAAFASWCPVCKEDAGAGGGGPAGSVGGGGGASRRCCNKMRRRSLSETAEPPATDPLREHNRSYDPWKQQRTSAKGASYDMLNYQHVAQRSFDPELYEHGDVEENLDHGRICPTKRMKDRLMPFCSLNQDYDPEAANGGSFRPHDLPPEGRSGPPRCRVEMSPQKVLIDGPFATRRERCSGPTSASCALACRRRSSPPSAGDIKSPSRAQCNSRSPSPPPQKSPTTVPSSIGSQPARCLPANKRPMAGARSPPPLREPSPQKRGCPEWRGGPVASNTRPPAPVSPPPAARLRRSMSRSPENRAPLSPSPPPPAARGDYARVAPACCDPRRSLPEDCCCCEGGCNPPVKYQTKLSPASAAPRSPSPPSSLSSTHHRHTSAPMVRQHGSSSPPPGRRAPPLPVSRCAGSNVSTRSPFAGKSTSALPPSAPPVPVPQRRSLSPPACLTAEHAAAAAAAKAQQHSLHRQHQLARATGVTAPQTKRPPLPPQSQQQYHAVSASGDQPPHCRIASQRQEHVARNVTLQRHIADIEALRSRLRELRGGGAAAHYASAPSGYGGSVAAPYSCHPTGAPAAATASAAPVNLSHPGEGKRQRQRSESDPGHGVPPTCSSPPLPHHAINGVHSPSPSPPPPQRTHDSGRARGGGGERSHHYHHHHHHRHHHSHRHRHSQQQSDSREAKRARDASPPPQTPPPPLPQPSPPITTVATVTASYDHQHHHAQKQHHQPLAPPPSAHRMDASHRHGDRRHHHKKDSSPIRRLQKAYPRKRSPLQVVHCHDSSDSDYEDQTADYDSKAVAAEDSEEDSQSIMSSLTTASSSDSVTPSVVGETLGAISLSDVAISITNPPRAPVKPLTPPRPPQVHHRKANFPRSLRGSLFSHVPPYIRFSMHDAKGDHLPPELGAILKWKLSTITPVVVRRTLVNSGFRLVRSECSYTESNEWSGTWGKHMKSLCFRTLKEFQKINHFPGTFQIGRKDRLWKNLYRLMTKFGRKEFGFIPRTYVLPQDSKLLRQAWEKNCGREKWIIKPPASARGAGIKVIHRWAQIPKRRPLVVQKYIADPYLINGSKFDLRLYVLVTSMNPMRVYIYDDGLVRFASVKYSGEMSTLNDRYMHLTNYSINKLSSMYTQNEDATACQGHKWTVKTLWSYMEKLGVDIHRLWDTLVDLCIKTIISGETAISQLTRTNLPSRYCSYELFGIDVLLDENLKPWLLEVNISPSLHSASPLDLAVKGPLVRDLMNLAGYHVPNKLLASQTEELLASFGVSKERVSSLCFDRRLYTTLLSQEERQKHHLFQSFAERDEYLTDIVDKLTPDDVRHLIQAEDELTQAGRFIRIFPTPDTWIYLEYFESPTYYNRLFDAWESKYHDNRQEGIERLESLCRKKHHLMVPPATGSAKFSVNPQALHAEGAVGATGIEGEKKCTEENTLPERKLLTLSSVALYRAARPRSGKPGVVLKPFPRSSYVSRKPRTSTPGANVPVSAGAGATAATPPATATAGGGDGGVRADVAGPAPPSGGSNGSGGDGPFTEPVSLPPMRPPSSDARSHPPLLPSASVDLSAASPAPSLPRSCPPSAPASKHLTDFHHPTTASPPRLRRGPDDDAPSAVASSTAAHPLPEGTACPC